MSTDFSQPEELSGAGGKWKVIDETGDSTVIQQRDTISCGPACAEMLLKYLGINDVNQELIASVTGTPVNIYNLAQAINQLDNNKLRQWMKKPSYSTGHFEVYTLKNYENSNFANTAW